MGVVYRAFDPELKRTVALKVLLSAEHASDEEIGRFFREAESAARLQHPNIVPIHELKAHEGKHYYTMDYIEGRSLDEVIKGGGLGVRGSMELIEKVARALGHAHSRGVVHRDLKPANIIVGGGGEPMITDFGLAKVLGEVSASAGGGLTRSGFAIGTPHYMAPEQAAGRSKQADARTDVYALGCILYEMLTGSPPFVSESTVDILRMHLEDRPLPPGRLVSRMPDDVETICLKCLEKEPGRRYRSADQVADDVRRYLDGEPIGARRASVAYVLSTVARRHKGIVAVTASAVVLLSAATGWYVQDLHEKKWIAEDRRREADGARAEAERQRDTAERARLAEARALGVQKRLTGRLEQELFYSKIALAQRYAREPNVPRLDECLAACPPRMRGWEWGRLRREGHQHLRVLAGFKQGLLVSALSPDGATLACGGWDREVRLLEVASGKVVGVLPGQKPKPWAATRALAFGPKGRLLAVGGSDAEVKLWDWRAKRLRGTLTGHRGEVRGLCFSPDGKLLASCGGQGEVFVWDAATLKRTAEYTRHLLTANSLDFSPDGNRLVSGGASGRVCIYDLKARRLQVFSGLPGGGVVSARLMPDGKRVAVASADEKIRLLLLEQRKVVLELSGHTDTVAALGFAPGGRLLVSASDDATVRVWDTVARREVLCLKGHEKAVTGAHFIEGGRKLITAGNDGTVRTWDALRSRSVVEVLGLESAVWGADFSPEKGKIFAALGTGVVLHMDPGLPVKTHAGRLRDGVGSVTYSVAVSRDGRMMASGSSDGWVRVWYRRSGVYRRLSPRHNKAAIGVAFSPDGGSLASAGYDGVVRVWDPGTGKERMALSDHTDSVQAVAYSPDGRFLASGGVDNRVVLREAEKGKPLRLLTGHSHAIMGLDFGPEGKLLASASRDGTVRVWSVPEGREVAVLRGHKSGVAALDFGPDKTVVRLASAGFDGTVRLWAPRAGRELVVLSRHTASVRAVRFSPDGRRLLSAGKDGSVRIWLSDDFRLDDRGGRPRQDTHEVERAKRGGEESF
jgi:WD40 repeat protein